MTATALASQERRRVLVVTVDGEASSALKREFQSIADVDLLPALDGLSEAIQAGSPHLLILDLDTIGDNARQAADTVTALREKYIALPIIGLTRQRSTANRVRAKGVRVFIAPADPDELNETVVAVLSGDSLEGAIPAATERRSLGQLIGSSEAMQRIYEAILRLADSNTTVLIRGESGSGKELAARAIVSHGRRSARPFISLNCAALPESLIEAELFGHEKGAYTGADRSRPGQIELADSGTLFLDEIATLTLALQTKLLRVLEDREVRRIGGNAGRSIDFRLITATNEDLEEMVKVGRFREDLYYRINVVPLDMPPLRDREGDIHLLVDHYLKQFCNAENIALKRCSPEALEILEDYHWPGNVRELENLMQRLVLMVTGPTIEPRQLPKNVLYASTTRNESLLIPEEGLNFEEEMGRIEAAYLRAALRRTDGIKKEAGKLLKLTPRQIKYLCHKHGL
jgi:DNA-binding NtrC family response regulator